MGLSMASTDLSPASSVWRPQPRLTHSVVDADGLEQLNAGGGVAVVFDSLAGQPVHLAFSGSQSATFSVWSTQSRYGFVSRPKMAADLVTIRFVTGGAMSRSAARNSEALISFDQVLFTSFEDMRFEQASPGFAAITASISRAALVDACIAMGGRESVTLPRLDQVVNMRTVQMLSLRTSLILLRDQLSAGFSEPDMMTPLIQDLLVYQIISAWPAADELVGRRAPPATDRPVTLAIDFIEANLRRKIGIADIAAAAGIGVRGLQVAFKRRMGCTPVHFLISRRLDKVHAALDAGVPLPVREIAGEWGFVHMSDFARRYRERFGRTPQLSRRS